MACPGGKGLGEGHKGQEPHHQEAREEEPAAGEGATKPHPGRGAGRRKDGGLEVCNEIGSFGGWGVG